MQLHFLKRFDNLTMANYPPLAFQTPQTSWNIQVTPETPLIPLIFLEFLHIVSRNPDRDNRESEKCQYSKDKIALCHINKKKIKCRNKQIPHPHPSVFDAFYQNA